MKILAVDYGDSRTGLAVCDPGEILATPLKPQIEEKAMAKVADRICQAARDNRAELIVVGLPRNMDGTEGARAQLCREFAGLMEENTGLPVALWDERRTTVEAHQILHATGKRMKQHKRNVDAVAASLILEGYLARIRQGDFRDGQAGEGRI